MLLMLYLYSYHRRLRMISEALQQLVEGGRVSQSWCMYVVSHGYDGLVGGQGWRWWTSQGVGRMSENVPTFSECEVIHSDTRSHPV